MPAIKYALTGENHGIPEYLLFDSAITQARAGFGGDHYVITRSGHSISRLASPGHPSIEVTHEAPASVPDETAVIHTSELRYGPDSSLQRDVLEYTAGEFAPIHPEAWDSRNPAGTEAGG